jgi:hypothetical protein
MSTLFPTAKYGFDSNWKWFRIKKISDDRVEFYHFDTLQKVIPRKPQIDF